MQTTCAACGDPTIYADPHDPSRIIKVKAIHREMGSIPGKAATPPSSETLYSTETRLDGGTIQRTGSWLGLTPTGIASQPLWFAMTKMKADGKTDFQEFKAYSAASHWLDLDAGSR